MEGLKEALHVGPDEVLVLSLEGHDIEDVLDTLREVGLEGRAVVLQGGVEHMVAVKRGTRGQEEQMFTVRTSEGEVVHEDRDEATALYVAVRRCTMKGEDLNVYDQEEGMWGVEADTKVGDDDQTFPAIVHWRVDDLEMRGDE